MRTNALRGAQRVLLAVIALATLAMALALWTTLGGGGPDWLGGIFGPPQDAAGRRIGIVAGHLDNDSGAVCGDGLTEAQVNASVANLVAAELRRHGATVDVLAEFDARLRGYSADAFVSIHADSCEVDLSGFKVATLPGGSRASDQLAACLWERYEAATSLPRHPATITFDMRDYHAFREIAPDTPAAIIEIGFLRADRPLLTQRPERAAAGIVESVTCFLTR